jgi:class 3 adenylate cyclase
LSCQRNLLYVRRPMSSARPGAGILTFLIADVRGYTSFTQFHGDEAAARLAAKFAEIAREGVEARGGT